MIDQRQFCALSSSAKFRDWLAETDRGLFDDLIDHLKKGFGCKANKEKMKQIFDRIRADADKLVSLNTWIENVYPGALRSDPNRTLHISGSAGDLHGIFPDYSPTLHTLPRRVIISLRDAIRNRMDLMGFVAEFCARQAYCDYIVTSDRAYVEYLPPKLSDMVDKIPDKNWRIPSFRMKQLAGQ